MKFLQQVRYYRDTGRGNFQVWATIAKGEPGYDGALQRWAQVLDGAKEYFEEFHIESLHSKMDLQEALDNHLFSIVSKEN